MAAKQRKWAFDLNQDKRDGLTKPVGDTNPAQTVRSFSPICHGQIGIINATTMIIYYNNSMILESQLFEIKMAT